MDGVLRPDLGTFLGVGLVAFVAIYAVDRGLRYFGLNAWTTSGQ